MSEQLYYTFSNFGPTKGERVRAQSLGLGPVNNNSARSLGKYLSYRPPVGMNQQIPLEMTPISLALIKTEDKKYGVILVHKVSGEKNGVARPGNFFTHAIINPEVVSPQTGKIELISVRDAIGLWKSPFWKTTEEQAPPRSTEIESLIPEEIRQYAASSGSLSVQSVQQSYPYCPTGRQTVADWFPLVFSAFLMLKKLNKKHLYIAAPAEMVATFIWCIAHCLPRTLDIMQELTFSTYEYEIAKSITTITGTCWLPSANHSGPFVPPIDLPATSYQPLPTNLVLAINCYTQRATQFEVDDQVKKFVQFATESLRQNDTARIDQLTAQAERKNYQNVKDFLNLADTQQKGPTKEIVQDILRDSQRWFCLQYPKVQDKLIDLIRNIQDTHWVNWWTSEGEKKIQEIYRWVLSHPQSEEATALRAFADRVMRELNKTLATDLQWSNKWAMYWDQLLKDISSPTTDLVVWATLPKHLSQLAYTQAYKYWWQESGKKIAQELYQIAKNNTLPEHQQLTTALNQWWQQCAEHLRQTWTQRKDADMSFWLEILVTIQPPKEDAQNWKLLLNELNKTLPPGKISVWCPWEPYKTLLLTWYLAQQPLPEQWLLVDWEYLPSLLDIPNLPSRWKRSALAEQILRFQTPASAQPFLSHVARCSPLIHEILAQCIQKDNEREQVVMFCEFLLQQGYTQRDALLASILPVLFPYEDLTNRIATAARLSETQRNEYMKDAFYDILTSQQDIPKWLLPQLKSYLTNFRVETLNPDHQQIAQDEYKRTRAILHALKGKQTLPEQFRPYVSCWSTISNFFSRPVFDPKQLRAIRNSIRAVELGEAIRQELHQEMMTFLSRHVDNESDLTRVIDLFGDTLLQSLDDVLPARVLLLKEMVHVYSKQPQDSASLPKTITYIKLVLSEAVNLAGRKTEPQKREQFTDDCLRSLLTPVDQNLVKSIQTQQWSPAIAELWESYQSRGTIANSPRPTKNAPPNSTVPQPTALPDSPKATQLLPQITPEAIQANTTGKPPTPHNPKADTGKKPFVYAEETVKAFRKVLKGKKVDQIAEEYDERLDQWLQRDEIQFASIARKLIQIHEQAKKTGDYKEFIYMYNLYNRNYTLSKDIIATVQQILEKEQKQQ